MRDAGGWSGLALAALPESRGDSRLAGVPRRFRSVVCNMAMVIRSPLKSSGSQPSLPTTVQRNRLTPRSAEACRRTGIEPGELLPLPREAFRVAGQSAELERTRWQAYEDMRLEAYQTVRAERDRILLEQGDEPFVADATLVAGGKKRGGMTDAQEQLAAQNAAAESAAESAEMRAIEKIKKKQQTEIEQMLMFEIRSAQLNKEKEDKVAALKAADVREKAERQARQHAAAELRLQVELERRDAELVAEKEARRRQRAEMERDKKRHAAEEEAERQRLVELDRRDKERAAKAQARRDRQQVLMAKQQEEAYAKQEIDAEREAARLQRLEEKRQKMAEELAASRERAQRRIALTMQMKEERTEQQRSSYMKKLANEERRRAEWTAAKNAAIDERVRNGVEKLEHIRQVQSMMEMHVEARKNEIIGRERVQMEVKAKADAERAQSLQATATEKEMKVYARHLKMARHQRRDEYKREVTTAKITMEGQRTEDLLQRKEETLARRRQMRSSNSLARQSVNERLDKMRQSSSFDVDDEMREMIQNEELQELLRRCDGKTGGAGKVGLDTMRLVLAEMQSEGKLGSMGGASEKSHGGARHSQSEGDLSRPRSGR